MTAIGVAACSPVEVIAGAALNEIDPGYSAAFRS